MKAVILAGGYGTRIMEESSIRPKPMVEIGGIPILWHILKLYSFHGINDFVICCGYKGNLIKDYFLHYHQHSDFTIDLENQDLIVHKPHTERWRITLVDTGENTMTGGRVKRVQRYLDDELFCMTYGDGVADVNISASIAFHKANNNIATLTAVHPPGRFGAFTLDSGANTITTFQEKPSGDGAWINGGFFVLSPKIFDYIDGDSTIFEREPLECLATTGKLGAFRHEGFWQPMDTLRDKHYLEKLWDTGAAPWKVWDCPITSKG